MMKNMRKFSKYQIVAYIFIAGLAGIVSYQFFRPIAKTILIDIFNIDRNVLDTIEPIIYLAYLGAVIAIAMSGVILNEYFKIKRNSLISNELNHDTYSEIDYKKVKSYYDITIKDDLKTKPSSYHDIEKHYPKSVYAITGGWRSGKTTAAGMLLDIMRKDKDVKILSETYHDTFNFGNINESITSFFETLSEKTEIKEFKQLGQVSTPAFDMNFNVGPISFNRIFRTNIATNEMRQRIFEKLSVNKGIHLIIIDDIDRLLANDQVQWLKVIELLGKFHGKLLLIIPIHIDELNKRLETVSLTRNYIEKILPQKFPVGVDIPFIKDCFFNKSGDQENNKKLYSKYLISLALRESLSVIGSNRISRRNEWINLLAGNGISGIAKHLYKFLMLTSDQLGLEPSRTITVGNDKQISNLDSFKLNWLFRSGFLITAMQTDEQIMDETDVHALRNMNLLELAFDDHVFVERDRSQSLDPLDPAQGSDYWSHYIWPVISDLETDPNLSTYFTYQDISKEVMKLRKAKTAELAREMLIRFVLEWDYKA